MLMAVEGVVLVWCNYFEPAFGYMCAIFRTVEVFPAVGRRCVRSGFKTKIDLFARDGKSYLFRERKWKTEALNHSVLSTVTYIRCQR